MVNSVSNVMTHSVRQSFLKIAEKSKEMQSYAWSVKLRVHCC